MSNVIKLRINELLQHYMQPIQHLFELEGVTEIWVNRCDEIFIKRYGERTRAEDVRFANDEEVATLITQISRALDQDVHPERSPVLDARLPDGNRVCGVLAPTSTRGACISFRIFPKERITDRFLLEHKALTQEMLDYIRVAMICRRNGLVAGATGSGKTTVLNVMCGFIPEDERVVTAEDTQELQLPVPNLVHLEAPKRRTDADYDLPYMIRTALRMDPTRIIVGEIRDGVAAAAFLRAVNTGHSACSTIHANSPEDALVRIQNEVAGYNRLPFEVVRSQVRSNLDFIVFAEDTPRHGKRIVSICDVVEMNVVELWRWDYIKGGHVKTEHQPRAYRHLEKYGPES